MNQGRRFPNAFFETNNKMAYGMVTRTTGRKAVLVIPKCQITMPRLKPAQKITLKEVADGISLVCGNMSSISS